MAAQSDLQLVELQLALEGIGFDARGRLIRIPATAAEDIPRLYLCHHNLGWTRYYRSDVPPSVVDELDQMTDETCFSEPDHVRRILGRHRASLETWVGTSYVFLAAPHVMASPDVTRLERVDRPLAAGMDPEVSSGKRSIYSVIVAGRIVSTCISARENDAAAEAWVQTSPDYRRRGFARQVTAAWARDVLGRGKIAFYSHRRDNLASRGVASSLGLRRYVDGVGYL